MGLLRRYGGLLLTQLRASLLLLAQYRLEALFALVLSFFWTLSALVPLGVLFSRRDSVAGWSWAEALVVVANFSILKGLLNAVIQPSLQQVVEHVRKGTLDFVLLKPADAQFLVSTARFELKLLGESISGCLILGYALWSLGRVPGPGAVIGALVLLACGFALLYAIWILVVSLAFTFVKIDNLSYLFASIYDAARWPASVFRGFFAFVFTFILPLALMTTYPALALLDRLEPPQLALPIGVAALFLVASRLVWLRSIKNYTSAGG